jgi:hypothetical protein
MHRGHIVGRLVRERAEDPAITSIDGPGRGSIGAQAKGTANDAGGEHMMHAAVSGRHRRHARISRLNGCVQTLACVFIAAGCMQTLDAGYNLPSGLLPVDQRNPIVIVNDGAYDNWFGEYAVLLANGGGSPLAGIIVNEDSDWPDIQKNVTGYRDLIAAARSSGLTNLPDPIASIGAPLAMPSSGRIEDTRPNRSEGALFIVSASKALSLPHRPLVVATGGALTDVADAYLVDPTVTQRLVVVSSLGSATSAGGGMGPPNGDGDPWADVIVTAKFRYVQVSAWYDQLTDVPSSSVSSLPQNALGAWIAAKQPNLWQWSPASDQVSVLAIGVPGFATAVTRVSANPTVGDGGATVEPDLATDQVGPDWLVTGCDGAVATRLFWKVLGSSR